MADRVVRVAFDGDARGLSATLKQLKTGVSSTTGQSVSKFDTLKGSMLGAWAAAGGAVVAGAMVKKFLTDSVAAFQEAEIADLKLQNTMLSNAGVAETSAAGWDKFTTALRVQTGVDDEAAKGLISFYGQVGMTSDQIKELVPLTVDLSAKLGIDLTTAGKAVAKATQGTTTGLSRMGIFLDKDAVAADAFGATMDGLQKKVGGFAAEEAKTLDGQLKILASSFEELQEEVGGTLVPYLTAAVKGLNMFTTSAMEAEDGGRGWATELASGLYNALPIGQVFGALGDGAKWLTGTQDDLTAALDTSAHSVGTAAAEYNAGTLSSAQFSAAVDKAAASAKSHGASEEQVAAILGQKKSVIEAFNLSTQGTADAHKAAGKAARDQLRAELGLAGGMTGLIVQAEDAATADRKLGNARQRVTRLEKAGLQGTKKYTSARKAENEAARASFDAHNALAGAFADMTEKAKESGTSARELKGNFFALASQFGINRSEARHMWDDFVDGSKEAQGALDALPGRKTINVELKDSAAKLGLAALRDSMNAVPDTVTTTVTLNKTPARPRAAGGPVAAGRPYIVGERGPELMVPRGAGNVVPNHRLGGGDTYITIHADPSDRAAIKQVVGQALGERERRTGRMSRARFQN